MFQKLHTQDWLVCNFLNYKKKIKKKKNIREQGSGKRLVIIEKSYITNVIIW